MVNDRIVWFICIFSVALGFFLGIAANSQSLDNWNKAFGVASALGTLITAFIAGLALTTWKTQAKYSERIDAAKKFRLTALEIVSITCSIKMLYAEIYRINNKDPRDSGRVEELGVVLKKRESELLDQDSIYMKNYDYLTFFLTDNCFSEFNIKYDFSSFHNRIYDVIGKICDLENVSDLQERCGKNREIDEAITRIREEINSDFEKLVNH